MPGNSAPTETTTIRAGADIALTVAGPATASSGSVINYNYTALNNGPNAATNFVVQIAIPAGLTSMTPPAGCVVAGSNYNCTIAGPITINTTTVSSGNPTNSTTISATGPTDINLGNNTATDGGATISAPTVDHRANKSGPVPALVVIGNSHAFSISSTNTGNAAFVGTLRLTDALPAGLSVTGYTLNGWTCLPAVTVVGPASIVCNRIFTAGAPLAAGAIVDSMTVSAPIANIVDGNAGNTTTTYGVTGSAGAGSADISVLKSVPPASVPSCDVQTVRLEVANAGPQPSANISLTDNFVNLLNDGVGSTGQGYVTEVVAANAATGIICTTASTGGTSRRLTCSIANLPVCTAGVNCPVISAQMRFGGGPGLRTNTANAISSVTADLNLVNNTGSASFTVLARAAVTVTKTVNPDPVAAGQNLTYTIAARNAPPGLNLSAASIVTITDTLPLGVTFISAAPSTGSCSVTPTANTTTAAGNRTVTCNVGTVANGAQQTVSIVVRPNFATRGTTIRNDVVISTTTPEIDTTNNSAFPRRNSVPRFHR